VRVPTVEDDQATHMVQLIQGRSPVPSPPPNARILEPGQVLPVAACLDGYGEHATKLMQALQSLSKPRNTRERLEHGPDAISALDDLGADLSGYVQRVWQEFADLLPAEAAMTLATTHPATKDKLIEGTGWTGFVLNRDTTLAYHRDTSNAPGWTAVLALRENASGGWLHLPEPDVWLRMDHGHVALFPGLETWHGVSPIELGPDGYRWSLVTYPKRHVPKTSPQR